MMPVNRSDMVLRCHVLHYLPFCDVMCCVMPYSRNEMVSHNEIWHDDEQTAGRQHDSEQHDSEHEQR
jgi:hypothetical protein